ncbi:hypothetical protein FUSO7_00880 [Fusobacterium necrophorum BFTR-2]|nr:hypothetical protein [Fusobacterium necrophorum]KDE74767.1 hypothetical protein FUSO7_00880 [Fusobacterium necrophorum BFTR-2]
MKLSKLKVLIATFGNITFKDLENIAFSSPEMKEIILGKGDENA